jgi:hypothetical protein
LIALVVVANTILVGDAIAFGTPYEAIFALAALPAVSSADWARYHHLVVNAL